MSSQSLNTAFESAYDVCTGRTHKSLEKVVCLRCGRPLINEKSRQARLGPKCARKLAYETRTRSFSPKTLQCQKIAAKSSMQQENIPTKEISLYYNYSSTKKPYCKIGKVSLLATDSSTTDGYHYQKRTYSLPLLEGVIYKIGVYLPQVRVFLLQVKDHQLREIGNSLQ